MDGRQLSRDQVPVRVLLVDENERESTRIQGFLEGHGFRVFRVGSGDSAYNLLDDGHVDVVISQISGHHIDGLKLLSLAHRRDPETCVVLLARSGELVVPGSNFAWHGGHSKITAAGARWRRPS